MSFARLSPVALSACSLELSVWRILALLFPPCTFHVFDCTSLLSFLGNEANGICANRHTNRMSQPLNDGQTRRLLPFNSNSPIEQKQGTMHHRSSSMFTAALVVTCALLAVDLALWYTRLRSTDVQQLQAPTFVTPPMQGTQSTATVAAPANVSTEDMCDQHALVMPLKYHCKHSPFFFLHLPISGGTSFHYVMEYAVQLQQAAVERAAMACPGNLVSDSMTLLNKQPFHTMCPDRFILDDSARLALVANASTWDACHYFTSHDDVTGLYQLPCNNYRLIALLRHPLEHRWSMWNKRWHVNPAAYNNSFTQWLESDPFAATYQLHFLAGISSGYPRTYLSSEQTAEAREDRDFALRLAMDTLNTCSLVGVLERMSEMKLALAKLLNLGQEDILKLQDFQLPQIHVNHAKAEMPESAQDPKFISRVLFHEMKLYEHALLLATSNQNV
eukprot:m.58062 g.58062  ORF g.58062 m.58062 type:complete len:446 (-) comp13118_c0_seq2:144-1481(-)